MKIRIDLEKFKKVVLSRVMILLFFLIGVFFSGVRPILRISGLRDKIRGLERRREEELGKLEVGERKIEKIQEEIEILEEEREKWLNREREERRVKGEFQNLSAMKGIVAALIRKNGIEIESIGRAALREIKDEERSSGIGYIGKRYEGVVPYNIRGRERMIKKLFADFHGREEDLGLKGTPLEVRYPNISDNDSPMDRKIEVSFRAVGIVGDIGESDELEKLEIKSREDDFQDYHLRRKVVERGYITVGGRDYEVVTLDDGRKSMRRMRGKSLEKTH